MPIAIPDRESSQLVDDFRVSGSRPDNLARRRGIADINWPGGFRTPVPSLSRSVTTGTHWRQRRRVTLFGGDLVYFA